MKKKINQLLTSSKKLRGKQSAFIIILLFCLVAAQSYNCNKCCGPAPVYDDLYSILHDYKWQLMSATTCDGSGNVTSVYKGTPADSLFFMSHYDSSTNLGTTNIESFVSGNHILLGFIQNLDARTIDTGNVLICAQPWKPGYSDTVQIMPVLDPRHQQYIVFKIGKPNNNSTDGYEIDSLHMNGVNDRWGL